MIYRGTVQGGVIVLNGYASLPEGTPVEILPRRRIVAGKSRSPRSTTLKPAKARKTAPVKPKNPVPKRMPGFGAWRDRSDIGDTAAFVRRLRDAAFERTRRG